MQANDEVRWASVTRIAGAALVALALLILGSCRSADQRTLQQEMRRPPTGTCTLSNGDIFPDVSEAWCTQQGGSWTQGYALLSTPLRGSMVDSIPFAAWRDVACGDTTAIDYAVVDTAWIEWKFAWLARDSATARANFDSMNYQLVFDDTVTLALPDSLTTRFEAASVACADSTMAGVMISRIVYLEPLFGRARKVTTTFTFNADVNDGWSTYSRGSSVSASARLRPNE